jgi:hypothetical protein
MGEFRDLGLYVGGMLKTAIRNATARMYPLQMCVRNGTSLAALSQSRYGLLCSSCTVPAPIADENAIPQDEHSQALGISDAAMQYPRRHRQRADCTVASLPDSKSQHAALGQ